MWKFSQLKRRQARNDNLLGAHYSGQSERASKRASEPKTKNIEYIFVPFYTQTHAPDPNQTAISRFVACRHCRHTEEKWCRDEAVKCDCHICTCEFVVFVGDRCDAIVATVAITSLRLPHFTFYISFSFVAVWVCVCPVCRLCVWNAKQSRKKCGARKTNDRVIVYTRRKLYCHISRTLAFNHSTERPDLHIPARILKRAGKKHIVFV